MLHREANPRGYRFPCSVKEKMASGRQELAWRLTRLRCLMLQTVQVRSPQILRIRVKTYRLFRFVQELKVKIQESLQVLFWEMTSPNLRKSWASEVLMDGQANNLGAPENSSDFVHGRPLGWLPLGAKKSELENLLYISETDQMMEIGLVIDSFPSRQQLQQDDSIAIYIRLFSKAGSACIFRINVTNGSHDVGRSIGLGCAQSLCNSKVGMQALQQHPMQYEDEYPNQMLTVKQIPEATVFHVVVKEKMASGRQGIALATNEVTMLNAPNCFKFGLKLLQVLRVVRVQFLYCNRLAILKNAFVHCARCPITDYILLAQILRHPHNVLVNMKCHVHIQDNQLRCRVIYCHKRIQRAQQLDFHFLNLSVSKLLNIPGLSIDPSIKVFGYCGLHAATKIIRRITKAPKAMPRIAALEIDTETEATGQRHNITR
nr:hypothetical protein Iba_chr10bCG12820 [Ipomoea batatas]